MAVPSTPDPQISLIIPVLNEAAGLPAVLEELQAWRGIGELIIVDGGSDDDSLRLMQGHCDLALQSMPGRARQMRAGAELAKGNYLLFLHADTRLSVSPEELLDCLRVAPHWGFFQVALSGRHAALRMVEFTMNLRSRLTSVATGDQGLLLSRQLWDETGGFADIPLMEDVEFCKRLRRIARPLRLPGCVLTSSRRWEQKGVLRTILLMWSLRLAFWLGASPTRLARVYYGS